MDIMARQVSRSGKYWSEFSSTQAIFPGREFFDLYTMPKTHPFTPNLVRFGSCGEWLAVAISLGLWTKRRLHGLVAKPFALHDGENTPTRLYNQIGAC